MSFQLDNLIKKAAAAADPRITPERVQVPSSSEGSFSGFSEPAAANPVARFLVPHVSESVGSQTAPLPAFQTVRDSPASPPMSQRAGVTVGPVYCDGAEAVERVLVPATPPRSLIQGRDDDPNLQYIPRLRSIHGDDNLQTRPVLRGLSRQEEGSYFPPSTHLASASRPPAVCS